MGRRGAIAEESAIQGSVFLRFTSKLSGISEDSVRALLCWI
jgi:hypothetical protein